MCEQFLLLIKDKISTIVHKVCMVFESIKQVLVVRIINLNVTIFLCFLKFHVGDLEDQNSFLNVGI